MSTFRAQALSTVGTGTHVAAVGHFHGESKDSLAVIPMRELAEEPPSVIEERFVRKLPIADYAYRLAAGPCGENAIVFFRDPEDDEDPDEDDGEDSLEDTSGTALSTADIRGHRGFYIRTLDGALRSKVPWNGAIATGAQIASSHQWIAADCGDAIATLAVATPSQGRPLRGRWLGVSPDGCRILMATEQGQLGLLTLP